MRNRFFMLLSIALLSITSCVDKESNDISENDTTKVFPQSAEGEIIKDQYIIEIKPEIITPATSRLDRSKVNSREDKIQQMTILNEDVESDLDEWLNKMGIEPNEVLHKYTSAIVGVAIKVTPQKFEKIKSSNDIRSLEHDRMDYIPKYKVEEVFRQGEGPRAQTTPCGITNAGGAVTANTSKWAWIVDSGIDLDHSDLNVVTNTTYAKSLVGGSANDCNGHGTHVAGTVGAINNTYGVIGMAAGAPVVPVRVFGCSGGSPTSTIVAGINHVATYDYSGDVMNLSLGGYFGNGCSNGSAYRSSITAVANGGTWVAIASGNDFDNANLYQPACVNGSRILTVTNMRCNGTYYNDPTYGGNFGSPPVDWIATGTSVYSTYLNGGYATLTGTSMATPHVAGICHIRNANPRSAGNLTFGGVTYKKAKR